MIVSTWNGVHDLEVDGLAELPTSVATFMGIFWIHFYDVYDVDGSDSEAIRERMLSHTLVDAIMLGWRARYLEQDMYCQLRLPFTVRGDDHHTTMQVVSDIVVWWSSPRAEHHVVFYTHGID